VLLSYSQLDGLFRDAAGLGVEPALQRLFSQARIGRKREGAPQFPDLVASSRSMLGTEEEFFLAVRERFIEPVDVATLDDHPSRHGVMHGRVLGYDNRRRAAQAFAFLAACLELLIAGARYGFPEPDPPAASQLPRRDGPAPAVEGLQFIVRAKSFAPVRSVYLGNPVAGRELLMALPADGLERWLTLTGARELAPETG
jgi:hypothetical protein